MEGITITQTDTVIAREIYWLEQVIDTALALYFKNECPYQSVAEVQPPELDTEEASVYADIVRKHASGFQDRLLLITALAPYIKPQLLDLFLIKNKNIDHPFVEFGGVKDEKHYGFYPTLETVCFLMGGAHDISVRLAFMQHVFKDHPMYREGILVADKRLVQLQERLQLSEEYLSMIITATAYMPNYSAAFPAQQITTKLSWEDLVLEARIQDQLTEVLEWLRHKELILNDWQLDKTLKLGYRVLFYGAPGTGKTLAATLLGKAIDQPVFRVDLSQIVSKYIGETEKNLGRLFDMAASKQWILFFDEADALFSNRTQTNSSNDRHANQEVAYLLQRIENFDGLVILATNLQTNIDEAFLRRFQSTISFPKPRYKERKLLWERLIGSVFEIEEGNDALDRIAKEYELSGGEMINVVRYCAVKAAQQGAKKISIHTVMTGIKREYQKSNKTFN